MTTPQELVENVSDLVSMPEVALRINELVNDPESSADDLGKVIAQDPGLAARLLKIANSPLFGLSKEVSTIPRAVAILGMRQLRDLVMSTTAAHAFDGIPNDLISLQNFWRHSLYCGLLSQALARHSTEVKGDSMFIAGLLHDIGQLVMFNRFPEQSTEALMLVIEGPEEMEVHEAEQRVFGFDHTQVGSELIRHWHLPELIQECVLCHHTPENAVNFPAEVAIVHIANSAAVMTELHTTDGSDEIPPIHQSTWQICKLSPDVLEEVIQHADAEITEIERLLFAK